jgi:adenylate cyclase
VAQENEHKYLVRSGSWRNQAHRGERYRQGYLSTDPERNLRVRVSGDTAVLTIKGANKGDQDGLQRAEFEYPIPIADAN